MTGPQVDSSSPLNAALQMLKTLRHPQNGCPWLSSRNFDDLFPYFLEELHEYRQAVKEASPEQGLKSPEVRQELADLLFQVLLHSTLLQEAGGPSLEDLAQDVCLKLERRHPHVFDPQHRKYTSAQEAGKAWEELKLQEAAKAARQNESREALADKLERIPSSLPALQRASRIGEKTQGFGFDWESPEQVFAKVEEEFEELKSASSEAQKREELGDLLFSLAQYARHLDMPVEEVADEANRKFLGRFRKMQELCSSEGLEWRTLAASEKESLWRKAKLG